MPTTRATSRHRKETYTGRYVDYNCVEAAQIELVDIAHHLAHICRFGGAVSRFYSVAEHAILVAGLLQEADFPPHVVLGGLHHDDHEAYLGDLPTPLKNALGGKYEGMREAFDAAICARLDLAPSWLDSPVVHWADAVALRMEAATMMYSAGDSDEWAPAWERWKLHAWPTQAEGWIPGMSPEDAKETYLDIHSKLWARL